VIGIAQNDIGIDIIFVQQKIAVHPFNRSRSAHWHKNGGLDASVCGVNNTCPCFGEGILML
jgi:hypothetical protein